MKFKRLVAFILFVNIILGILPSTAIKAMVIENSNDKKTMISKTEDDKLTKTDENNSKETEESSTVNTNISQDDNTENNLVLKSSSNTEYEYEDTENGIIITKYIGNESNIVIPDSIDGKSVTIIGDSAFYDNDELLSVSMGNSIKSIENNAFYDCNGLTSITIPDNVEYIGDYAFQSCDNLKKLVLGKSVKTIGNDAFEYCGNIEEITISDNIETIGSYVFYGLEKIKKLIIPLGVTNINEIFYNFASLEEIVVDSNNKNYSSDNGVLYNKDKSKLIKYPASKSGETYNILTSTKTIENNAFCDCDGLTSVTIPDNVEYIGDYAFQSCDNLKKLVLGKSVKTIGNDAFEYCGNIEEITISDNIETIGSYVFYGLEKIKKLIIPLGVTNINEIFYNFASLEEIVVDSNNKNYSSDNGVLYNKDKSKLIKYPASKSGETYNILTSTKTIENNAFCDCDGLTSVTIPDNVEYIGDYAFQSCDNLKKLVLGKSVKTIGNDAFEYCGNIEEITISDNIETIGSYVFYGLEKIKKLIIPLGVTNINEIFYNFASLEEIVVDSNNKNYSSDNGVLYNKDKSKLIKYPVSKAEESYSILTSTKTIENNAFYDCNSLASITIPDNVEYIGEYAFFNCDNLKKLVLGKSVKTIGNDAFEYCRNIEEITISDNIETIGSYAFYGLEKIKKLIVPSSITKINEIFYNFVSLEEIVVDSNNKNYSSYNGVLYNKDKSKLIKYPASKSGETYNILNITNEIGDGAFRNAKITSIVIPDNISEIGTYAFYECEELRSVIIGKSIREIKDYTFSSCGSLNRIIVPSTVETISYYGINDNYENSLTIYGDPNSYAYTYAVEKNIKFDILFEKAWYNPDVKDSDRTFFYSYNSAKYLKSGSTTRNNYNFDEYYRFTGKKNKEITIKFTASVTNNDYMNIYLRDKYGNQITALEEVYSGETKELKYKLTESDVYYVVVNGGIGRYSIGVDGIDSDIDTDNDGLYDSQEYYHSTNILVKDTDNDGVDDYTELKKGTNPSINTFLLYTNGEFNYAIDMNRASELPTLDKPFYIKKGINDIYFKIGLAAGERLNLKFISDDVFYKNIDVSILNSYGNLIEYKTSYGQSQYLEYSAQDDGVFYIKISGSNSPFYMTASINSSSKIKYTIKKQLSKNENDEVALTEDYIGNYKVEIFNKTRGIPLDEANIKGSYIFLSGLNVSPGDEIELKLTPYYYNDETTSYLGELTLDENKTGEINIVTIQKGYIKTTCTNNYNINVFVFDKDGNIVDQLNNYYDYYSSRLLDNGEYTILYIKGNSYLWKFQKLSDYSKYGLIDGKDYISKKVTIKDGEINEINNITVPDLNEDILSFLDKSKSNFIVNTDKITVGGLLTFRLEYKFKENTDIQNSKLTIDIPEGATYVGNSLTLNGEVLDNVQEYDDSIQIELNKNQGVIIFNVKPYENKTINSSASITFYTENTYYTEHIGKISVDVPYVTINGDKTTETKIAKVYGIAPVGSTVSIFDGDVQVGIAVAGKSGKWNAEVGLNDPYGGSVHKLVAKINLGTPSERTSNSIIVSCTKQSVSILSLTMIHNNNKTEISQEQGAKPIITFVPGAQFTFIAKATNSESIEKMYVVSVKGTEEKEMELVYDKVRNLWCASGFFDESNTSYVPGEIEIRYTLKSGEIIVDTDKKITMEDYEQLPEEWKNAEVNVNENTENKIDADIILDNENQDKINVIASSEDVKDVTKDDLISDGYKKVINDNDNEEIYIKPEYSSEKIVINCYQRQTKTSEDENPISSNFKKFALQMTLNMYDNLMEDVVGFGCFGPIYDIITMPSEIQGMYNRNVDLNALEMKIMKSNLSQYEKQQKLAEIKNYREVYTAYSVTKFTVTLLGAIAGLTGATAAFPVLGTAFFVAGVAFWLGDTFSDLWFENLKSKVNMQGLRWSIDPSGYVYEGVSSNRLEGVKATAYYKNQDGEEVLWNAEEYEQLNPIYTDKEGRYAWDVPEGLWRVKYELDGYETVYSEWMNVPPPQTDVNIGMISLKNPEVLWSKLYEDSVEVHFDKYIKTETINSNNIKINNGNSNVGFTVEVLDEELSENNVKLAKTFKLKFNSEKADITSKYILSLSKNILSYAEVGLAENENINLQFENSFNKIVVDEEISCEKDEEISVLVKLLPKGNASNLKLSCVSAVPDIAEVVKVGEINSNGESYVTVKGNISGETELIFSIEDSILTATSKIVVNMPENKEEIEYIKLSDEYVNIDVSKEKQLTATIYPTTIVNKKLIWESSNSSIVKVNDEGLLTGINEGEAIITVFDENKNKFAKCIVKVNALAPVINSFTVDKTSPQTVKTAVTLTTKVSGVTGTAQYKYYRYLNGAYGQIKDWSTSSSITIAPSTAGKYDLWVAVKDGSGKTVKKNIAFEFKNQANLGISSFTANKTSPQVVKTAVTLTTKVSGVTGTAQYKYYRYLNGVYGQIKDWSTSSSITIAPSTAGKYDLWVAVKDSSGRTVKKNIAFEFKEQANLGISSFTASKTSPQVVKTAVTLTTKVSGVTGTAQYKYYRYLNGVYGQIKDWSTSSSITIAPSTAGKYDLWVAVKDSSGKTVKKNIGFEFKQQANLTISSFIAS
ncbi:MAG: leucine-rich repeat protein [Clostridium sp.]